MLNNIKRNTMLKVDINFCNMYKPSAKPISYFKTSTKCSRLIQFDDKTFMHIETDYGNLRYFVNMIESLEKENFKINVQHRYVDDKGRVVTCYTVEQ